MEEVISEGYISRSRAQAMTAPMRRGICALVLTRGVMFLTLDPDRESYFRHFGYSGSLVLTPRSEGFAPNSMTSVIGARMSHWKWRETKQHPSRARSGHQISCCLFSLHFLCDILAPITVQYVIPNPHPSPAAGYTQLT